MRITCVIVSYNNGTLLEEAIMSVVRQTWRVDEIIVADDASTDGSRQFIDLSSRNHPSIRPILRERNLGVSANRDLAVREARGEFVTCLDGDDRFLPTKIEAEAAAIGRRSGVIAFSDVRVMDRKENHGRTAAIADFSRLATSDRVRWLLDKHRQSPSAMLLPKDAHLRIGGYNHSLKTYEDWDYTLRLAARPFCWVHSGTEGLEHHPGGGLSNQRAIEHMRDQLRVLRLNEEIVRRHVGVPGLLATAGRVIAFRSKWGMKHWYWRRRGWID